MDFHFLFLAVGIALFAILYIYRSTLEALLAKRMSESYPKAYRTGFRVLIALVIWYTVNGLQSNLFKFAYPLAFLRAFPFLQALFASDKAIIFFGLLMAAALFFFIFEIKPLVSTSCVFILSLIMEVARNSEGKINHSSYIVAFVLIAHIFYYAAYYSKKHPEKESGALFTASYFLIGLLYFTSFLSKVGTSKAFVSWISGENIRATIVMKYIDSLSRIGAVSYPYTALQSFFIHSTVAAIGATLCVFIFEGGAILLPWVSKWYRTGILIVLTAFHIGNIILLNIVFKQNIAILLYLASAPLFQYLAMKQGKRKPQP